MPWCASLVALQRLKHLKLRVTEVNTADFVNLSSLTGLTQLYVQATVGLVASAAAPVLSCLTGLQHLLFYGDLGRQIVPVIAQLTQLRGLSLNTQRDVWLSDDELHMLSPLKQLTSLRMPLEDYVRRHLRAWLSDMPRLKAVNGESG